MIHAKELANLSFEPMGPVLIRTPLLAVEEMWDWRNDAATATDHQDTDEQSDDTVVQQLSALQAYLRTSIAREAILVGSGDLFEAAARFDDGLPLGNKRTKNLESSLRRYLVRMATRPTPFGLFAGVALGSISENTSITLCRSDRHKKRTRPDMGWLLSLSRTLANYPEVFRQLSYFANPLCIVVGNRLYVPFTDTYGLDEPKTPGSFKATKLLAHILTLTKSGIDFESLRREIKEEWPDATEDIILATLTNLHKNGVIIDSLRPPLTGRDAFEHLRDSIATMPECDDLSHQLEVLATSISGYNSKAIGDGVETLAALKEFMNDLVPDSKSKSSVQIDMSITLKSNTVSNEVAQHAALAAEALFRLATAKSSFPHLEMYRKDFVERYGAVREVPLVELLDPRAGLGPPATYQHPTPRRIDEPSPYRHAARNQFLLELASNAIKDRQREVALDERMLQCLETNPFWRQQLPQSLDLYVTVCANSQEEINDGDFRVAVGPSVGAQPAGRSFGRFYDVLDDELKHFLQRIAHEEEQESPSRVFAELVFTPFSAAAGNVLTRPASRQYEIVVGAASGVEADKVIELTDLVVGVRAGLFYLKSLKHDVDVVIRNTHMYNYFLADNVYRFISEVSADGSLQLQRFDWGTAAQLVYLPRLRYGRIILCPARWKISMDTLNATTQSRDGDWVSRIVAWRAAWSVPRFVLMAEGDNRLFLDLDDPRDAAHLNKQSKRRLEKGGTIELQEMLPDMNDTWVRDVDGRGYFAEFVIPMRRLLPAIEPSDATLYQSPHLQASDRTAMLGDRIQLPGGEWLFAKLYCAEDVQDDVIADQIEQVVSSLVRDEAIQRWFFIRYGDPEPHLRLRFGGERQLLLEHVLPRVSELAQQLIDSKVAYRLVIDSYDREVERYGGAQAMPVAEEMFYTDSVFTTKLLDVRRRGLDLSKLEIAILSVDELVSSLGLDSKERSTFYTGIEGRYGELKQTQKERLRKEFFQNRKRTLKVLGDREWICKQREGQVISDSLNERSRRMSLLGRQLRDMEERKTLTVSHSSIVHSLVHMHLNRLNGVDSRLEYDCIYYLNEDFSKHRTSSGSWSIPRNQIEAPMSSLRKVSCTLLHNNRIPFATPYTLSTRDG